MMPRPFSLILALLATACARQQGVVKVVQSCNSVGYCEDGSSLISVASDSDWPSYGRTPYGDRHSPLRQITPDNVSALEVAWRFHTGEGAPAFKTRAPTALEVTPLVFRGTMYVSTPLGRVFALDPTTGAHKATPTTYLGADGRQFVVIAAGGDGKAWGLSDEIVAFALPSSAR